MPLKPCAQAMLLEYRAYLGRSFGTQGVPTTFEESTWRSRSSALAINVPQATSASLAAATKLTHATVNKSLAHLERLQVVTELTSKQRGRVFNYALYTKILNEGMDLPEGSALR